MQLHSSSFDPTTVSAEAICRRGRGGLVALTLILWSVPVILWVIQVPRFVVWASGILFFLVTVALFSTWRNRGRPGNWTLAVTPERIWINLRNGDHLYDQTADSVLSLVYSDVREAARFAREFTVGAGDDQRQSSRVYLELRLARPVPREVREALDRVQKEELPARSYLGGLFKMTGRVTSFPVEIADSSTLRIHWSGQDQSLKPRLSRVLELLSRYLQLGEAVVLPAEDPKSMDEQAFERYVVALSRTGQTVAAVSAVQQRQGISLTEAKALLETLERRNRSDRIALD